MYFLTIDDKIVYLTTEGRKIYPTHYLSKEWRPKDSVGIHIEYECKGYMEDVWAGKKNWKPLTRSTPDATVYTPREIRLSTADGYVFGPPYTFRYTEMETDGGIWAIAEATQESGRGIERMQFYVQGETSLKDRATALLSALYTEVYREHWGRTATDYTPPTPPELTKEPTVEAKRKEDAIAALNRGKGVNAVNDALLFVVASGILYTSLAAFFAL